jgi:peptidoglycan/LPS O-acetylase OafA/YrhL
MSSRLPALDGVRGIAVLTVVLYHLGYFSAVAGPAGVTIFFVLSGYLITGILLRGMPLHTFYLRRARRLLPALYLLLAVMAVALLVCGAQSLESGLLPNLIYIQNYTGSTIPGLAHLWSLAVEEQFYILWPLLLLALLRVIGRHRTAWVVVGAIVLVEVWKAYLWSRGPFHLDLDTNWWRINTWTDTNADQLLIGCLAALIGRDRWPERLRFAPVLPLLGIAAIVLPAGSNHSLVTESLGWTVGGSIMVALLAMLMIMGRDSRWLGSPVLAHFGRISYGLYLWHLPVIWLLGGGLGATVTPWRALSLGALSWGIAVLSYELMERRITGSPSALPRIAWHFKPQALEARTA